MAWVSRVYADKAGRRGVRLQLGSGPDRLYERDPAGFSAERAGDDGGHLCAGLHRIRQPDPPAARDGKGHRSFCARRFQRAGAGQ